ncbi:hypothetical protein ACFL43_03755 [Thermodesulfobacteriota bacterium]
MRLLKNTFLIFGVLLVSAFCITTAQAQEIPGCCKTYLNGSATACFGVDDAAGLAECDVWNNSAPNMSSEYYPGYVCVNGDDPLGCSCEPLTLIELEELKALPLNGAVEILWSTAAEIDNAGFNIYRSDCEGCESEQINDELIPAEGSPTQGAEYSFVDDNVKNRTEYSYKLEDVDLDGQAAEHGPVSATPRLIYGIGK